MAGEPTAPLAPPTGVGGTPEPAAASPAAAPAASEPAVAAPASAHAAAEPAAPVAAEPAVPASEPSLLEKFDSEQAAKAKPAEPKSEPKPDAAAKSAEVAPAQEVKPPEPAASAPVNYEYTLPETIKMDDALKGDFHGALDAFRNDPAKGAQGLVDLHNKAMQNYADELTRNQWKTFNDTRRGWQTRTMADPEIGGAGYETSMGAIARMRDLFISYGRTEQEAAEFRNDFNDFLKVTGGGDHPAFLKMLHTAARIMDEAPMPSPGAKPPANIGKAPGRGLRGMYKTNGQGRS